MPRRSSAAASRSGAALSSSTAPPTSESTASANASQAASICLGSTSGASRSRSAVTGDMASKRWTSLPADGGGSSQNSCHIAAAAPSTKRFCSRVSGVASSSSSADTSRITTHQASSSRSAAIVPGSSWAGIRANAPSV